MIREFNPPTVLVDSNDTDKSTSTKFEKSEEVSLVHDHEKEGIVDTNNQKSLANESDKRSQGKRIHRIKEEKKTEEKEFSNSPKSTNELSRFVIIEKEEGFEMMDGVESDSLDLGNNQEDELSTNSTRMIMPDEVRNDYDDHITGLQKKYQNEMKLREQAEENERKLILELTHICEKNEKELANLRSHASKELERIKTEEHQREREWEKRFQQETERYKELKEKLERMEKVMEEEVSINSSCSSKPIDRCNAKRDHENYAENNSKRSCVSLDASRVPNSRCSIM